MTKDPTKKDGKTGVTLGDLRFLELREDRSQDESRDWPLGGKIYVSFSDLAVGLERGDSLTLKGKIESGFGNFVASMKNPEIVAMEKSGDVFLAMRGAFAEQIRKYVDNSGLELGYLLGMKGEIDPEFEETLKVVGLTHIVVASGTHLGILVGFSRKIFGKISRFAGFLGAGLLIVVFVGITGLTPSMMRAAFVAFLSLVAWYFGRDAAPWRILLYAAAATLLLNPENLTDLAWQLSFGSFTGLMLVAPVLQKFFYGEQKPGFVGSSLITSLSTMLCCAPILLLNFGEVSLLAIVANLLILPTMAPAMGLGLVTGICGLLGLTPIATVFGFLTSLILKYHVFVVNLLGAQTVFVVRLAILGKLC